MSPDRTSADWVSCLSGGLWKMWFVWERGPKWTISELTLPSLWSVSGGVQRVHGTRNHVAARLRSRNSRPLCCWRGGGGGGEVSTATKERETTWRRGWGQGIVAHYVVGSRRGEGVNSNQRRRKEKEKEKTVTTNEQKLLLKCCFTSTETLGLLGTGEPRTATSTFTQLLTSDRNWRKVELLTLP